jgi:hypothetical protein
MQKVTALQIPIVRVQPPNLIGALQLCRRDTTCRYRYVDAQPNTLHWRSATRMRLYDKVASARLSNTKRGATRSASPIGNRMAFPCL